MANFDPRELTGYTWPSFWPEISNNEELKACRATCIHCGWLYENHSITDSCPDDSKRRFELYVGVKE